MTSPRSWAYAIFMGWGYRCTCKICRTSWFMQSTIVRPTTADVLMDLRRHVIDYHGGMDQHD